jgi:hypothetical protein
MFRALLEISRNPDFRTFITGLISGNHYLEKQTHGVRLAVDEYWTDWWIFNDLAGRHMLPGLVGFLFPRFSMPFKYASRWMAIRGGLGLPAPKRDDFTAMTPPGWKKYCKARKWPDDAEPLRVILSLRPGTVLEELRGIETRSWRRMPIEFEIRPLVRGHSCHVPVTPLVGGISVGPGVGVDSGTLGGVLRQNGSSLVMTCAHVLNGTVGDAVRHPAASDHGRSSRIGAVSAINAPTLLAAGNLCNRTAVYAATSDVAIVALDSGVDSDLLVRKAGRINGVREIDGIGQYEDVLFVGKESDQREARTEQLSHWQEVSLDGQTFCYREVFTIGFRKPGYFARNLSSAGDSGSWILSDPAIGTRELLGVLLAGDGEKSFCAFAENAFADAGLDQNTLLFQ